MKTAQFHFVTTLRCFFRCAKLSQGRRASPKAKSALLTSQNCWQQLVLTLIWFNLSWFAHPDHKLLLCHMGKHGSTTWARFHSFKLAFFYFSWHSAFLLAFYSYANCICSNLMNKLIFYFSYFYYLHVHWIRDFVCALFHFTWHIGFLLAFSSDR